MYEHDNYIYHASTGFKWKHHKYIKKIGNKYIYPEDLEKAKKKIAESGATASAKAGASVGSKTLKKALNSAKKVNTSSGIDRQINKAKRTVNDVKKWGEFAKNAKIEKAYVSKLKAKNVATGKTENVYMRDSKDNKKAKAVLNVRLKKDPKNLKKYEDQYKKLDSINEKVMGAQTKAIDAKAKAKKKVDKALNNVKNSAVEKLKKSGHYQDPNEKKEPKILSQKIESGGKTKYIVEGKTVDKKAYNDYQKKNAPKSNSKPEGKLGTPAIKYKNTDGTVTYKIGNKKVSKSQYESYLKKKK